MQELVDRLEAIELKVKDLAEKYSTLKGEKQRLESENKVLRNDLDRLNEGKNQLELQLTEALAKVKTGKNADKDRNKLKKELGLYIKEIDKCILMMGDI